MLSKPRLQGDDVLLVTCSLCSKADDRWMDPSKMVPLAMLMDGTLHSVDAFRSFNTPGLVAVAWHPTRPADLYVSTGKALFRIHVIDQTVDQILIPNLHDLHEMDVFGNTLWLSNTGKDEVICYDLTEQAVTRRFGLQLDRRSIDVADKDSIEGDGDLVDKFHINQVFQGYDGQMYGLVHHVEGKQLIRRVAQKLLKSQGTGGVINLVTGQAYPLRLHAPHSVRQVNGDYWVFDSGNRFFRIYDADWRLRREVPTHSWGRGADLSTDGTVFYAGMSQHRRRYLPQFAGGATRNMIQAFCTQTADCLWELELPDTEQVSNVYVISRAVGEHLLRLDSMAATLAVLPK